MQKFIPVQIELYKNKIEHKRHKNQMLISEAYISSQYKWNETVNKEWKSDLYSKDHTN